jgi:hypothetical protein
VFSPVLDSDKRPMTAGGFVKTGTIVFQDISQQAGVGAHDAFLLCAEREGCIFAEQGANFAKTG